MIVTVIEKCSCGASLNYAGYAAASAMSSWRQDHVCPNRVRPGEWRSRLQPPRPTTPEPTDSEEQQR